MSRTERLEAQVQELEQRIAVMEKIQADGIDYLVTEIRRLFDNDAVIGQAAEDHDTTIAALRSLLVDKSVLTDDEIGDRRGTINGLRERAEKERAKEMELRQIEFRAQEAAKESAGHPKEAFIFGG
jgi:hypothetical protein